jgi:hypothetical protein
MVRQVLARNRPPARENEGVLHDVGQLANVPGPLIFKQGVHGFGRQQGGHLIDRPAGGASKKVAR